MTKLSTNYTVTSMHLKIVPSQPLLQDPTPLILNTFIAKRKFNQSHDNSLPNPVLKRHYHGPRSNTNRPHFKNSCKSPFFKPKYNTRRSSSSYLAIPRCRPKASTPQDLKALQLAQEIRPPCQEQLPHSSR